MDNRFYFVFGDLITNIVAGGIVGWVSWLIVGPSWNMYVAMLLMMGIGMLIGLLLFLPAAYFFGAMEVMLPIMLTGMVSGMVVGMWAGMSAMTAGYAFSIGAGCGLVSIVGIWCLNHTVRGVKTYG